MPITVHPLTPERLPDLDIVFQARGCSVAKNCYCMYYRMPGKPSELKPGETRSARNKAAMTHGATLLEAYPVDREAPDAPNAPWFGSRSMFVKAGFAEVARRKPTRPIVRLRLAGSRQAGS